MDPPDVDRDHADFWSRTPARGAGSPRRWILEVEKVRDIDATSTW